MISLDKVEHRLLLFVLAPTSIGTGIAILNNASPFGGGLIGAGIGMILGMIVFLIERHG